MPTELDRYLSSLVPAAREQARWDMGYIHLHVTCYLTEAPPPDALVTSARCVVIGHGSVLVITNEDGEHILPGGRREPGETSVATAKRELHEEAGLDVSPAIQMAVLHFHHTTPKPSRYVYPYPDFLQIVYFVPVECIMPLTVADSDRYETAAVFASIATLLDGDRLPPIQQALLRQAIAMTDAGITSN